MTFRCVSLLQQVPIDTPMNRHTHTHTHTHTLEGAGEGENNRKKTTTKHGATAHTVTQRACQRHAGPNAASEADNCQINQGDFNISLAPGNVSELTGPQTLAA